MPGNIDKVGGTGSRTIGDEYGPAIRIVARDYPAYLHRATSKFCNCAVACDGVNFVSGGEYAPLTPDFMGR
jgi:hypothetical protein